jgi:uncharacterized phiE125 gp8 family phage protein
MEGTYTRTVAATLKPITLDEAKAHCSVSGTSDHDEYLTALIDRATEAVELHTSRQIMPATWTLILEGFPAEITIHKPPVSAISSVAYVDTAGDSQTFSSDYYQTDLANANGPARIKPAYGYNWPSTRSGEYAAVTVTFTTGYATASVVPPTLKHAVSFIVAHWFAQREPVVVGMTASKLPTGLEVLLSLDDWGMYA